MTPTLRRALLTLLLPLALLAAQLGALQHGLGHLTERPVPQRPDDAPRGPAKGAVQADDFCVECLAMAMLGGPAPMPALAPAVPPLRHARPETTARASTSRAVPERRSRDPPSVS